MLDRVRTGLFLLYYFGRRARAASYLTHVSDRHRIVFVEVPKTGCTVVKRLLQCNELGGTLESLATDVHRRDLSPLKRPEESALGMSQVYGTPSEFFRFAFVRDPYSRALSTYLDKFVSSRRGKTARLAKLGLGPQAELCFVDFLRLVADQPVRKMDIHWAPQYDLMGCERISYDFVGRFETIREDLDRLTERLALDYPAEALSDFTVHTTGATSKMDDYFDDESVALVQKIYRRDFEEFDYPTRFGS